MKIKKRKRDLARVEVSEGGSATLLQLHSKAKDKRIEKDKEQLRLDEKRKELHTRKQAAMEQETFIAKLYLACKEGGASCGCGMIPCAVAKHILLCHMQEDQATFLPHA